MYTRSKNYDIFHDIVHDVKVSFEKTKSDERCFCKYCEGAGKYKVPITEKELLMGLLVDLGVKTNHTFPGDPCPWCDATGVNEEKQLDIIAEYLDKYYSGLIKDE